jgi:hypothetical protein
MIVDKVTDYLIDCVGDQTAAGTPRFDSTARRWHVPVLARTAKAIFPVGEFVMDEAGNFVSIPDKQQMVRIAEAICERIPALVFGDAGRLRAQGLEVVTV